MYQFRPATREDIEKIVKLVDSAYRGEISRKGWTTEADLLEGQRTDQREVTALLRLKNNEIFLCEQNKQLMASVHLCNKGEYAYLGMFAVKPDNQGKGIGKALLNFVENHAKNQWNCKKLEMTVIAQRKELISWYIKQGYCISGETRPFPYGEERFGVPKRDDLQLEVLTKGLKES